MRVLAVLPLFVLALVVAAGVSARAPPPRVCNVRDFGAKGDNRTEDTAAIQAAIDHCAAAPASSSSPAAASGGQVVVPAGNVFYTRPVQLRSGVTLVVDGA